MKHTKSPAAVAIAAGILLAVTPVAPASAHDYVVESTPAEGEVLTALPEVWEIVTDEPMLHADNDAVFGLWARDADGLFYGDGCVDVSGTGMSAAPAIGEPGSYTLVYSLVSADGHPVTGEIPFEWAPTGETEAATGSAEAARCGTEPRAENAPGAPGALWVVGAVGAVGVAVVVTVLFARRRRSAT
jgi:methionine-rich copper-binding protein CopC